MNPVVRPAARRDITLAYRWYRARSEHVAQAFLDVIETRVALIGRNPELFPVIHRDTRRCLLGRFPYALYFRLAGDGWRVIACTHLKRHARRWQNRR